MWRDRLPTHRRRRRRRRGAIHSGDVVWAVRGATGRGDLGWGAATRSMLRRLQYPRRRRPWRASLPLLYRCGRVWKQWCGAGVFLEYPARGWTGTPLRQCGPCGRERRRGGWGVVFLPQEAAGCPQAGCSLVRAQGVGQEETKITTARQHRLCEWEGAGAAALCGTRAPRGGRRGRVLTRAPSGTPGPQSHSWGGAAGHYAATVCGGSVGRVGSRASRARRVGSFNRGSAAP